jgi:hypothetical protein
MRGVPAVDARRRTSRVALTMTLSGYVSLAEIDGDVLRAP